MTIAYDEALRERIGAHLAGHERRAVTDPTKRHAAVAVVLVDSELGEDRVDPAPVDEWIGGQMRGTICGMVAPGRAREAARLAYMEAEVSAAGNGILGEVFNAVLAARAYTLADTRELLVSTCALFSTETEYGAVLAFALEACRTSPDWQTAWARCDAEYVEYNWIHVYPNAAAQVVALWFGEGDFDRTLEIICGIGHDVDCNAAQILCVIGIQKRSGVVAEPCSAT